MRIVRVLAIGFLAGLFAEAIVIWRVTPGMTIAAHERRVNDLDKTSATLQTAVAEPGWNGWAPIAGLGNGCSADGSDPGCGDTSDSCKLPRGDKE